MNMKRPTSDFDANDNQQLQYDRSTCAYVPSSSEAHSQPYSSLNADSLRLELRILRRVATRLRSLLNDVRRSVQHALDVGIASAVEELAGTSAWLFSVDCGVLSPIAAHNTPRPDGFTVPMTGNGICAHVARTQRPYSAPDVRQDEHYLRIISRTRSEIAAPIMSSEGLLLAVANIEAHTLGAFNGSGDHQYSTIEAICRRLAPLIVASRASGKASPPVALDYRCEWRLDEILLAYVSGLRDGIDSTRVDCSVWIADWASDRTYVSATTGYDHEYVAPKSLPLKSFTGHSAAAKRGFVRRATISEAEDFVRRDKAERMGVIKIMSIPIYADTGENARALGALNVYSFDETQEVVLPEDETIRQLTAEVGRAAAAYTQAYSSLVREHIHSLVYESGLTTRRVLDNVLRFIVTAFKADTGRLLARELNSSEFFLISEYGARIGNASCQETRDDAIRAIRNRTVFRNDYDFESQGDVGRRCISVPIIDDSGDCLILQLERRCDDAPFGPVVESVLLNLIPTLLELCGHVARQRNLSCEWS